MIPTVEKSVLRGLINDEDYARRVLPYVKDVYFETSIGRAAFSICSQHFHEYNQCPTPDVLRIAVESAKGYTDEEHRGIEELIDELSRSTEEKTSRDFLVDTTEEWCKERAIYHALSDSLTIYNGSDKDNRSVEFIPKILTDALAVSFDPHVGHDYLGDYNDRYDFYHKKESRISFGLEYLDKITKGGIPNKTLNIILAGTGVGKSLFMCDFASKVLMQGKNVLYITLEMAEQRIAERIDANLMDVNIQDLVEIPFPMYEGKIQKLRSKTPGNLHIKEYPTASAHAGHFDALLTELQLKKSFKPDIVFIDYLNICTSQRYRSGSNINSYTIVKSIAEEVRGLAGKHVIPIVSATQTTRSGFQSSDISLTDTSESFGLPATADLMLGISSSDELESMGQVMVKQLKNRYNDLSVHKRFVLGIDRAKMRLYDVEQSAQNDILESEPTYSYNNTEESKFKPKQFADFSF